MLDPPDRLEAELLGEHAQPELLLVDLEVAASVIRSLEDERSSDVHDDSRLPSNYADRGPSDKPAASTRRRRATANALRPASLALTISGRLR
jgi:hypothetical protein